MKKIGLLTIALVMALVIITGCTKETVEDKLYKVLTNKVTFKYDNKDIKLDDYIKDNPFKIDTIAYAYVDMDNDSNKELVTYLEGIDAEYMVFKLIDKNIYAYKYSMKNFQELKEDGTYKSVTSDKAYAYLKSSYDKETKNEKTEATVDDKKHTVEGKETTKEAFEDYEKSFNEKKKVEFTKYQK